jgi:hypothetical protein
MGAHVTELVRYFLALFGLFALLIFTESSWLGFPLSY